MRLRNLAIAIGSLGLVVTPIVAQAANETVVRDAAPVESAENLSGSGIIIALLALAAVVAGVIIAVEDDNTPTSP